MANAAPGAAASRARHDGSSSPTAVEVVRVGAAHQGREGGVERPAEPRSAGPRTSPSPATGTATAPRRSASSVTVVPAPHRHRHDHVQVRAGHGLPGDGRLGRRRRPDHRRRPRFHLVPAQRELRGQRRPGVPLHALTTGARTASHRASCLVGGRLAPTPEGPAAPTTFTTSWLEPARPGCPSGAPAWPELHPARPYRNGPWPGPANHGRDAGELSPEPPRSHS